MAPRLLVIDDEPAMRETVCELLRFLGYDVEAARDEADGLARLARERFDLVVTDLHMPHLDGWDVLESARAIAPEMPVIILTGTATDEDLERARARSVRLLSKPCDLIARARCRSPATQRLRSVRAGGAGLRTPAHRSVHRPAFGSRTPRH